MPSRVEAALTEIARARAAIPRAEARDEEYVCMLEGMLADIEREAAVIRRRIEGARRYGYAYAARAALAEAQRALDEERREEAADHD